MSGRDVRNDSKKRNIIEDTTDQSQNIFNLSKPEHDSSQNDQHNLSRFGGTADDVNGQASNLFSSNKRESLDISRFGGNQTRFVNRLSNGTSINDDSF